MTKFNRFHGSLLLTTLFMVYAPMTQADMQQGYDNMAYAPVIQAYEPQQQTSYGEIVGNKALNSFANISTGWLEVPKNIINTINQSNFFYGVFGGFLKGLVNTLGRTGAGIADFLTIPIPTKPIVYPLYIWDNFDVDTTYGEVFRLDVAQEIEQPVTQMPITQPAPTAVATPPQAPVVDYSNQYNQEETNRKLDTLFNKKMQK